MLKLILSSLQLLPLRPHSPLCQVPTLLLTPLMLSLLQMKTQCRRIEKQTEDDVLVTQKCVPTTENVCTKETVKLKRLSMKRSVKMLFPRSVMLLLLLATSEGVRLKPRLILSTLDMLLMLLLQQLLLLLHTLISATVKLHCHKRHQNDLQQC